MSNKTKITSRLKFKTFPLIYGLMLVLAALALVGSDNPDIRVVYDRLEGIAYDFRLRTSLDKDIEVDPRIVIVDIDEKSLAAIGRWPWPRAKIASLIDSLVEAEIAVIGLDVLFAEPELSLLDRIEQSAQSLNKNYQPPEKLKEIALLTDGDLQLAASIQDQLVVLGYTYSNLKPESTGQLPSPVILLTPEQTAQLNLPSLPAFTSNIGVIESASAGSGFFLIQPDSDGVIRRAGMLMVNDDAIYPSLALSMVYQYFGLPELNLIIAEQDDQLIVEGISLEGVLDIPTDNFGRTLIPFLSQSGGFKYISAVDVIQGKVDKTLLQDAIVLVGTTAAGLHDLRATPVDSVFPGVEVHAHLIAGIIDQTIPATASWAQGLDIAVLILVGILFGIIFPLLRPGWLIVLTFVGIIAYIYFSFWMWKTQLLVISLALPVLLIFLLGTGNTAFGFLSETKGRKQLKSMFGQYVPPELVDDMNSNPSADYGFDGQSRDMTVLFCDIRSFTSMSEKMQADELKKMLNFFFTPMTETIFNFKGTIDKYVGDMIMAFWGAPVKDDDHREHAIRGALHMLKQVSDMQDELTTKGWPPIKVGIGLNSGKMNVGDMGSSFRRSYTVIGDAVNLGSRLEGLTKFYGVELCVSESTREGINTIIFRSLDKVRVKGKNEGIKIFEPIGAIEDIRRDTFKELAIFEVALESYYQQDWEKAEQLMQELVNSYPEAKLYHLYVDRIKDLKQREKIKNWDGVYTHTSK